MPETLQQGAGATATAGTVRSIDELTTTESVAVSVRVSKPGWMRTRFPVSMEEYEELVRRAEWADPSPLTAEADDTLTEDPSTEIVVARTAAESPSWTWAARRSPPGRPVPNSPWQPA